MNLGAHMSIAGGLHLACERGRDAGCNVIQMFVKNERQWKGKTLEDDAVAEFRTAMKANRIHTAFAHDTYLINMASPKPEMWQKSVDAFVDELERCEALGLAFLVTHPGSPGEAGEAIGIANMSRGLNEAHQRTKGYKVRVLLETTAGQGATVGRTFEQMKGIFDGVTDADRLGICLDTCHVFAAGYDISTPAGYEATFDSFDRALGIKRLEAFHVNDSKKGLGCRVDRHENIGKGMIGLEAFRRLMRDARFRDVPKVIETPKEDNMDPVNLKILREFALP
jgi:deoxyribonuclease IV